MIRLLKVVAVLALLGAAGWQGALFYRTAMAENKNPPRVPTTRVARGDLRLTLSSFGTLEATNVVTVRNEQVESQLVDLIDDGTVVTKGQVIARLDRTKIERQVRDRKLAHENAKAALKRVEAETVLNVSNSTTKMKKAEQQQSLLLSVHRAELDKAKSQLTYDKSDMVYREKELDRTQRLVKDQLLPAADLEQKEINRKAGEVAIQKSESQLEVTQSSQPSAINQGELLIKDAKYSAEAADNRAKQTVENARFNLEAARKLLELSEKQLGWCEVRATASGLATIARDWDRWGGGNKTLSPGDPVRPGSRLVQIIDLSKMRVVADLGEMDASQIKVGQAARVWPRSAPDQVLKGQVLSISKLARQGDTWRRNAIPGKKTFRVVLDILESRPDLLRPGLTADFEILQGRAPNVLRVPLQALFKTSKGTSVFLKKGDRFVAQAIQLGQRNANFAAVVGGLKGGEEVAVRRPPIEVIGDGQPKPPKQTDIVRRTLGIIF